MTKIFVKKKYLIFYLLLFIGFYKKNYYLITPILKHCHENNIKISLQVFHGSYSGDDNHHYNFYTNLVVNDYSEDVLIDVESTFMNIINKLFKQRKILTPKDKVLVQKSFNIMSKFNKKFSKNTLLLCYSSKYPWLKN